MKAFTFEWNKDLFLMTTFQNVQIPVSSFQMNFEWKAENGDNLMEDCFWKENILSFGNYTRIGMQVRIAELKALIVSCIWIAYLRLISFWLYDAPASLSLALVRSSFMCAVMRLGDHLHSWVRRAHDEVIKNERAPPKRWKHDETGLPESNYVFCWFPHGACTFALLELEGHRERIYATGFLNMYQQKLSWAQWLLIRECKGFFRLSVDAFFLLARV